MTGPTGPAQNRRGRNESDRQWDVLKPVVRFDHVVAAVRAERRRQSWTATMSLSELIGFRKTHPTSFGFKSLTSLPLTITIGMVCVSG
jgi:hypothetical protein